MVRSGRCGVAIVLLRGLTLAREEGERPLCCHCDACMLIASQHRWMDQRSPCVQSPLDSVARLQAGAPPAPREHLVVHADNLWLTQCPSEAMSLWASVSLRAHTVGHRGCVCPIVGVGATTVWSVHVVCSAHGVSPACRGAAASGACASHVAALPCRLPIPVPQSGAQNTHRPVPPAGTQ